MPLHTHVSTHKLHFIKREFLLFMLDIVCESISYLVVLIEGIIWTYIYIPLYIYIP